MFLLVTLALAISFDQYYEFINPPSNYQWLTFRYPLEVMIYFLVGFPCIMGSLKLLLLRKTGIVPSIVGLVLFDIPFLNVAFQEFYPWNDLSWRILAAGMFFVDVVMIAFVVIGAFKMFIRSESRLSQNYLLNRQLLSRLFLMGKDFNRIRQ